MLNTSSAAMENIDIFIESNFVQKTGKIPERPSMEEIKKMILRHAQLQLQYKGEYLGIREMRKHVAWYTTGLPNSVRLRAEINAVESYEQLESLLNARI